jgi:translation elongation factor EF-Tu-like GTPase
MFDFFNTKQNFETSLRELEDRFEAAIESFKQMQVMPIVTQSDDLVTITFKGPNVTTTVTTTQVKMPEVLKQFGLEMPGSVKKTRTTKNAKA